MRRLVALVGLLFALTILVGCARTTTAATPQLPSVSSVAHVVHRAGCTTPTPTSAAGFNAMFAKVPTSHWGGADGSLSVKLPNGLVVWLYGDTLSGNNGFVHSSAIVQQYGCLHVSFGGAQVIANDSPTLIYWIDSAKITGANSLDIRAAQIRVGTAGPWDFHATGKFRTTSVAVTAQHDLKVIKRGTLVAGKPTTYPYTKNIVQCAIYHNGRAVSGPTKTQLCPASPAHEISYNPFAHSWAHMSSGKVLVSVCYNNDGPKFTGNYGDYRPKFFEVTG